MYKIASETQKQKTKKKIQNKKKRNQPDDEEMSEGKNLYSTQKEKIIV